VFTKKERLERLGKVRLFSDLSGNDLRQIVDASGMQTYDEGETIIKQGDSGVGFQLILEGEAKVVRNGRTLAKLGPDDFFGEMALIDEGPRSASIVAAAPLTTLNIASWDFRPLVKRRPEMAWKLLVHLTQRLREEQTSGDALRA
jgi:CRP/FNR family transcriptional regulator